MLIIPAESAKDIEKLSRLAVAFALEHGAERRRGAPEKRAAGARRGAKERSSEGAQQMKENRTGAAGGPAALLEKLKLYLGKNYRGEETPEGEKERREAAKPVFRREKAGPAHPQASNAAAGGLFAADAAPAVYGMREEMIPEACEDAAPKTAGPAFNAGRRKKAGFPFAEKKENAAAYDLHEKTFKDAVFASADMEMFAPQAPREDSEKPTGRPRNLEEVRAQVGETFQESLLRLIDQKGLTDAQVYKKAGIDRRHFAKIRKDREYQPGKKTAVALAVALELSADETADLLARAGYALSPGSLFDMIVRFFIEEKIYDFYTIDEALLSYDQPLLSAS